MNLRVPKTEAFAPSTSTLSLSADQDVAGAGMKEDVAEIDVLVAEAACVQFQEALRDTHAQGGTHSQGQLDPPRWGGNQVPDTGIGCIPDRHDVAEAAAIFDFDQVDRPEKSVVRWPALDCARQALTQKGVDRRVAGMVPFQRKPTALYLDRVDRPLPAGTEYRIGMAAAATAYSVERGTRRKTLIVPAPHAVCTPKTTAAFTARLQISTQPGCGPK